MTHIAELDTGLAVPGYGHRKYAGTPAEFRSLILRDARRRQRRLSWRVKSMMDRLGALILLITFSPILLMTAFGIRASSPGPIFFRQPRYGLGGEVVVVTKFRTMRVEGTDMSGRRQATRDDDRVTRIGRFLRRTCLDELPQLWDVLCGRMSLVGPRPHALVLEVEGKDIEELIPHYHERHRVRPGVTGLAQVNGNRGPVENVAMAHERVRFDLEYIRSHSLLMDIRILFRTLAVPFQKDGSF
ncbi:sugar transferase [Amaricoccus tamworthensis]|uniref:sugar transferase n=1 Tax=Amaricoccus tamworthensis TaxID=57002 RepID=UPI003C7C896F